MGSALRLVFGALAFGVSGLACAGVIGLSDFEIVDDRPDSGVDAGGAPFGDGSVTTADGIEISPTALTIPPAQCSDPSSATLTIVNHGAVQTSYSATTQTAGFTIQNGEGFVSPGASVTITVIATGPTNGTAAADITVTAGTAAVPVHVVYASKGAVIGVTPSTVDFGTVHDNIASAPSNLTFTNSGTSDVTVTALTGMTDDFTSDVPFTIPAGQSVTHAFTMIAGTSSPAQATVTLATDTPLCGAAPRLMLRGARTNDDITVNPVTLDLGDIPCNAAANPTGTVTISNYGGTSPTFTANNSPNFPVSPNSGTLAAASGPSAPSTAPLTVSFGGPTGNPQTYSNTFDVTVNNEVTTVTVQARVVGARWSESSSISTSSHAPTSIQLKNQGNVPACVSYALANDPPGYYHLSVANETIAPSGTSAVTVAYLGPFGGFGSGGTRGENAVLNVTAVACGGAGAPVPSCMGSLQPIQLQSRQ